MDIYITTRCVLQLKLSVECFAMQLKVLETIIGGACFPAGQGLCSVWEAVTIAQPGVAAAPTFCSTHSAVHILQHTAQTQTGNNEYTTSSFMRLHRFMRRLNVHKTEINMYISKQIMWPVELIP